MRYIQRNNKINSNLDSKLKRSTLYYNYITIVPSIITILITISLIFGGIISFNYLKSIQAEDLFYPFISSSIITIILVYSILIIYISAPMFLSIIRIHTLLKNIKRNRYKLKTTIFILDIITFLITPYFILNGEINYEWGIFILVIMNIIIIAYDYYLVSNVNNSIISLALLIAIYFFILFEEIILSGERFYPTDNELVLELYPIVIAPIILNLTIYYILHIKLIKNINFYNHKKTYILFHFISIIISLYILITINTNINNTIMRVIGFRMPYDSIYLIDEKFLSEQKFHTKNLIGFYKFDDKIYSCGKLVWNYGDIHIFYQEKSHTYFHIKKDAITLIQNTKCF